MAKGGVNKVILIGNLGQDPEVRCLPNGTAVATIGLATSESWRDKSTGETKEQTEWHRLVLYRRLAEIAGEFLKKGSTIYIQGRLRTRKWQDQSGQDRFTTEIQVDDLLMLDSRRGSEQENYKRAPDLERRTPAVSQEEPQEHPIDVDFDDEIPF